ncbi:MAG: hypothetical protein KGL39_00955 [Patescibacteria group bacterium]|nr:hypothetical protein [Patescibacteria group bacterium]
MMEITYLPEVECNVTVQNGILNTQVVYVPDENGNRQYLRVSEGSLVIKWNKTYLPVGIVQLDYKGKRALVELPQEADSGVRRLWVPFDRFCPDE